MNDAARRSRSDDARLVEYLMRNPSLTEEEARRELGIGVPHSPEDKVEPDEDRPARLYGVRPARD